jgi:hypothetical protein
MVLAYMHWSSVWGFKTHYLSRIFNTYLHINICGPRTVTAKNTRKMQEKPPNWVGFLKVPSKNTSKYKVPQESKLPTLSKTCVFHRVDRQLHTYLSLSRTERVQLQPQDANLASPQPTANYLSSWGHQMQGEKPRYLALNHPLSSLLHNVLSFVIAHSKLNSF